jgi:hypothetical protein
MSVGGVVENKTIILATTKKKKKGGWDARIVGRGGGFGKGAQDTVTVIACFFDAISKSDHVERDIVLFEFTREADESAFGLLRGRRRRGRVGGGGGSVGLVRFVMERGADKDDNALT